MNDIAALRTVLFETLQGLSDKVNPMPIERAKAIGDIAQVIINSAKVEVNYMQATKSRGTGFLGELPAPPTAPALVTPTQAGSKSVVSVPGGTVTSHRMR